MGMFLNPGNGGFQESIASQIYIDKSGLISYTNKVLGTKQKFICVSRPRRFGKSMAAEMLAAYYGRGCDSRNLFRDLKIESDPSFGKHLNQYNVIFLNMQKFLSDSNGIADMITAVKEEILEDILGLFPELYGTCNSFQMPKRNILNRTLQYISKETGIPFIFIIDEWDCIFREEKDDEKGQKAYLDFLRNLLKDADYVKLIYMTGILPIKKYGSHSALNTFDEFSMTNPMQLAEYTGFTEQEVLGLCESYQMDFNEIKRWYDGYRFEETPHIYNPRSVVSAMLNGCLDNFWSKTETFEALRDYIVLDFCSLKSTIIELLAGEHKTIDTGTFTNDMATFSSADDVLTLLVHLGYLGFDYSKQEIFIPNSEIASEFVNAIQSAEWEEVVRAVKKSEGLLKATWNGEAAIVASGIEEFHMEGSILTYNDENSLACTISLAYYSAKAYYTCIREFPSGKGFADIIFLPRPNHMDKPAMVVELKWNRSASGAISQIKERKYLETLKDYTGNILLVGINYDKKSKKHDCIIEKFENE